MQVPAGEEVFAGAGTQVDLPIRTTMQLLNATDDCYAKTLLDFALAANAVSFLVISDDWFCKNEPALSTTRAVPVVDASVLLKAVDVTKFDVAKGCVDFPVSFPPPPGVSSLAIAVPMAATRVSDGTLAAPPTPDFILVGPGIQLERAYEVQFVDGEDAVLTTFLNTKAGRAAGGGAPPGQPMAYQRLPRKRGLNS